MDDTIQEGSRGKILVADDAHDIADVLAVILKSRGFELCVAYNGTEAWKFIEDEQPEVAILDVIMPGINGLDLCKKIKEDPKHQHTQVVIMTSMTTDSEVADGFWKLGTEADDFVSKPFDFYEMADRVERIIERLQKP